MASEQDLYHELTAYTLELHDPAFLHQHVVDAFAAQHPGDSQKPITIAFALVGLYLHVEKQFTGRDVQKAHMLLAKYRKSWTTLEPPKESAGIGVADVMALPPGEARDAKIHEWCAAVWDSWKHARPIIVTLVRQELGAE